MKKGHFSRLPAAAVFDPKITPHTLRVLAALGTYADADGICWPGMSTLATKLQLSRSGVRYHTKKLEKLGYIYVERRKKGNRSNHPNRYQLRYPEADQSWWERTEIAEKILEVGSREPTIGADDVCPYG